MRHGYYRDTLEETLTRQVESFSFLRSVSDEPFTSTWFLRVKDRIRQSAMVMCLIGESTFIDNAVLWQLTVAYAMKKRVLGVVLHPEMMHIVPDVMVAQNSRIISLQDALIRYEPSTETGMSVS